MAAASTELVSVLPLGEAALDEAADEAGDSLGGVTTAGVVNGVDVTDAGPADVPAELEADEDAVPGVVDAGFSSAFFSFSCSSLAAVASSTWRGERGEG